MDALAEAAARRAGTLADRNRESGNLVRERIGECSGVPASGSAGTTGTRRVLDTRE